MRQHKRTLSINVARIKNIGSPLIVDSLTSLSGLNTLTLYVEHRTASLPSGVASASSLKRKNYSVILKLVASQQTLLEVNVAISLSRKQLKRRRMSVIDQNCKQFAQ